MRVQEVSPGVLRLSQPSTPGWVREARTPTQLARLVASAFTEAQIRAHAVWRNQPYEGVDTVYPRPARSPRATRADVHDPRDWRVDPVSGKWVAPGSGRSKLWDPASLVVQQVMAKRVRLGLPPVPGEEG